MTSGWVKGEPRAGKPADGVPPVLQRLFAEQRKQHLTDAVLADRAGWDATTLTRWRRGTRSPTLPALIDIAHVIGFDIVLQERPVSPAKERAIYIPKFLPVRSGK